MTNVYVRHVVITIHITDVYQCLSIQRLEYRIVEPIKDNWNRTDGKRTCKEFQIDRKTVS